MQDETKNAGNGTKIQRNGQTQKNTVSLDKKAEKHLTILDMGTGSGCIPISIAKSLSNANVYGLDISLEALEVAQENNKVHGTQVDFFQADILNLDIKCTYDIIVANPPYIRELEKADMQNNVIDYEPSIALFVPDEDPLKFYRAIVDFASKHLNDKGSLYLEINQYLDKEMILLLEEYEFHTIELKKDMYGNDRMLKGIIR